MMPAWLSYSPVDWTCDIDIRTDTNHPVIGHPPMPFEPDPAEPVDPRPIPANLPRSRGGGLVWASVVDQIEAYDDGRADPPGPYDCHDKLGRTA